MRIHYTAQYLLTPQHKITVNLVGLGGTGSQVLSALTRMNEALIRLDHPGLHVRAYDPDIVTDANVGRQLFSPADIGANKAVAQISRVNRFFGNSWEAYPQVYGGEQKNNILITCVDTVASRLKIADTLVKPGIQKNDPMQQSYYWMDFGNAQKTGQVVLGTAREIKQPESKHETVSMLPHVVALLPQLKKTKDKDNGPSCSLAEALGKQDLFINSTLCNLGMAILWKLFRESHLTHQGCYLNLESMAVNPIKI